MTDTALARAHRILANYIDPIVLKGFGLTIGLIDIPGAGRRIATWVGYVSKHMSASAARRFASDLISSDQSVPLKPVHDALMVMVDKLEEAG